MADLGTLPGDVNSVGCGINNRAQVAGASIDANGNGRAFLWENGQMYDLNSLVPPNSPLYLLHGFSINSSGEIVGFAYDTTSGEIHAYLAVPTNIVAGSHAADDGSGSTRVVLPENVHQQLRQWVRSRLFIR